MGSKQSPGLQKSVRRPGNWVGQRQYALGISMDSMCTFQDNSKPFYKSVSFASTVFIRAIEMPRYFARLCCRPQSEGRLLGTRLLKV